MPRPKPIEKLLQTSFRVSEKRKKELEEVAALRGQSVQALIDEAVDLRLLLTEGFWDQILGLAEKLNLPASTVVANMIVKQAAFQFAWIRVFHAPPPGLFKEFRFDADGFLSGERLSETLIDEYTKILKDFKDKVEEIKGAGKQEHFISKEHASIILGGQL